MFESVDLQEASRDAQRALEEEHHSCVQFHHRRGWTRSKGKIKSEGRASPTFFFLFHHFFTFINIDAFLGGLSV